MNISRFIQQSAMAGALTSALLLTACGGSNENQSSTDSKPNAQISANQAGNLDEQRFGEITPGVWQIEQATQNAAAPNGEQSRVNVKTSIGGQQNLSVEQLVVAANASGAGLIEKRCNTIGNAQARERLIEDANVFAQSNNFLVPQVPSECADLNIEYSGDINSQVTATAFCAGKETATTTLTKISAEPQFQSGTLSFMSDRYQDLVFQDNLCANLKYAVDTQVNQSANTTDVNISASSDAAATNLRFTLNQALQPGVYSIGDINKVKPQDLSPQEASIADIKGNVTLNTNGTSVTRDFAAQSGTLQLETLTQAAVSGRFSIETLDGDTMEGEFNIQL